MREVVYTLANKFQVWHKPDAESKIKFYLPVPTLELGKVIMNALIGCALVQATNEVKPNFSALVGINVWGEDKKDWVSVDS